MEGEAQKATYFHAALRAAGTLLPPGAERQHPTLRLEGGGLAGELQLKRKRLSPTARRRLQKTLQKHPEGTAVGLILWPRTQEAQLNLQASQVGLLYTHPRPELAGSFSALGLPQAWEAASGRLLLEIRPNLRGVLAKPFTLELLAPGLALPALGAEEALWVEGRLVEGRLVAGRLTPVPRPAEKPLPQKKQPQAAKGTGKEQDTPARRRRVQARPPG